MPHPTEKPEMHQQDDGHAFGFARHDEGHEDRMYYEEGKRGGPGYRERDPQRGAGVYSRAQPGGGFRGTGPKGYTRSDARILEEVCDRLCIDDTIDASDISVSIAAGEITLDGQVPSRATKRAAEDCAEGCAGVKHVQNNLRVQQSDRPG